MVTGGNGEHWSSRAATVGQLLAAVVAIVGGLTAFALKQEGRITTLEVRQNVVFSRLDTIEAVIKENNKLRADEMERINEKLTLLLVTNAQQHPPVLNANK